MAGSTFGKLFTVTTFGESHGDGVGVIVDGCPAGLPLSAADIQKQLDKRKPGQSRYSTRRKEGDLVEILSGVFDGMTEGTPIAMIVRNRDQHSKDYSNIQYKYRPGHADFGFDAKFGFRDYRGGGRSSGRETIGRVAAGAVAEKLLAELGISFLTYTRSIGPVSIRSFDPSAITENDLHMPDAAAAEKASEYLDACMNDLDSAGGVAECVIRGVPAGIGEPVFDKLDGVLGQAVMSIGAVKAVEIGDGVQVTTSKGSENNDPFMADGDGHISKTSNHAGGILGGISDGSDIILRAHIKPTASIARVQQTVNTDHENTNIEIRGRHDPVIVPRALVVIESMAAITITDEMLRGMSSKMDNVRKLYGKQ